MDFFQQQDQARRHSAWLMALFLLAVTVLILAANLLVTLIIWSFSAEEGEVLHSLIHFYNGHLVGQFRLDHFLYVSLAVIGIVLAAVIYKWLQLSEGGKRVAESLGGERLLPNTGDPDQRRALNVVEEMAIASGMPVPPVYLLADEHSINAFAAGNSPADAVIGLTRGTIEQLSRPQLQGVVAHEFSHILNGDMRLNLRLIALLHGIAFLGMVGERIVSGKVNSRSNIRIRIGSSSSKSERSVPPQVIVLGLGLMLIGWLGSFFGNMIRATVNRQREYLADASAVQFTRNPEGIADALKVIDGHRAGTSINNGYCSEVSHLFFGQSIKGITGLFATHPPLIERILRLDPQWDGFPVKPRQPAKLKAAEEARQAEKARKEAQKQQVLETVVVAATAGSAAIEAEAPTSTAPATETAKAEIPERLKEHARDPLGAMAVICGLLLCDDAPSRRKQAAILDGLDIAGLRDYSQRLRPQLHALPEALRLPLVELTLPALKCMSAPQYQRFKPGLLQLIKSDDKIELFEWCLYQLVRHYLAPEHEKPRPPKNRYSQPQQVADSYQLVLSLMAHHGHDQPEDAERAFHLGAGCANLYTLPLLPLAECRIERFIKAVGQLADCQPILKPRLLKGLERCIKQDGKISPIERDLITCIAAVMDCPLPNLEPLRH